MGVVKFIRPVLKMTTCVRYQSNEDKAEGIIFVFEFGLHFTLL